MICDIVLFLNVLLGAFYKNDCFSYYVQFPHQPRHSATANTMYAPSRHLPSTPTRTTHNAQGTLDKIQYFSTAKGGLTGRFCRASDVVGSEKTSASSLALEMGATVRCCKPGVDCLGTVRYFGRPAWATDGAVRVGLSLAQHKGDGDGHHMLYVEQRHVHAQEQRAAADEKLRVSVLDTRRSGCWHCTIFSIFASTRAPTSNIVPAVRSASSRGITRMCPRWAGSAQR